MKRFLIKWCIFFAPIFMVAAYYMLFIGNRMCGDIGLIGHIPFGQEYARTIHMYDKTSGYRTKLVSVDSASTYPLLLIGDSFMEPQFMLGHTIAEELDDTLHVVHDLTQANVFEPTRTLLYGLTHGCFSPGQTIILESIEWNILFRLTWLDFDHPTLPDNMRTAYQWRQRQAEHMAQFEYQRHNDLPTKMCSAHDLLSWTRIQLGYEVPYKHFVLSHPMFTHERYADQLYVINAELKWCALPQDTLNAMAAATNRIMAMAEAQGIKLYLLVVPNKYEMYHPYIVSPEAPKSNLLTFLDSVKSTRIINARDTLAPLLEQGEMDLWQVNDSHWGIKAGQVMGKKIAHRLKADSVLTTRHKPQTTKPEP